MSCLVLDKNVINDDNNNNNNNNNNNLLANNAGRRRVTVGTYIMDKYPRHFEWTNETIQWKGMVCLSGWVSTNSLLNRQGCHEDTHDMPWSRSLSFPRHRKKKRWGTNSDKTNFTYETSDQRPKRTATDTPLILMQTYDRLMLPVP